MPPWGAPSESGLKRKQPFVFGFRYTHFWYTLQPKPPFGVLAASHEFCIASPQDPQDCESVQFVSGLEKHPNGSVLMAYGVNDCEARVATMSLSKIWKMLKPLDGRAKRRGCARASIRSDFGINAAQHARTQRHQSSHTPPELPSLSYSPTDNTVAGPSTRITP